MELPSTVKKPYPTGHHMLPNKTSGTFWIINLANPQFIKHYRLLEKNSMVVQCVQLTEWGAEVWAPWWTSQFLSLFLPRANIPGSLSSFLWGQEQIPIETVSGKVIWLRQLLFPLRSPTDPLTSFTEFRCKQPLERPSSSTGSQAPEDAFESKGKGCQ